MGLSNKKLILRVTTKLLAAFAILAVVYVFIQGLRVEQQDGPEPSLWVDITDMEKGDVQHLQYQLRPILLLRRNRVEFTVAYAQDPVYGCPIEWQKGEFVSICNGSRFSAEGSVFTAQLTDEDMDLLEYVVVDENRLKINLP